MNEKDLNTATVAKKEEDLRENLEWKKGISINTPLFWIISLWKEVWIKEGWVLQYDNARI